jgi:hypothetical protein
MTWKALKMIWDYDGTKHTDVKRSPQLRKDWNKREESVLQEADIKWTTDVSVQHLLRRGRLSEGIRGPVLGLQES